MSHTDIIKQAIQVMLTRWKETIGETPISDSAELLSPETIYARLVYQTLIVRKSAQEILCSGQADAPELVATDALLNALFDYHFLKIRTFPPHYPAGLLDALCLHCFSFNSEAVLTGNHTLSVTIRRDKDTMMEVLKVLTTFHQYTDYPSDARGLLEKHAPFNSVPREVAFLMYLRIKWGLLKMQRLERSIYSPMPWAIRSREDASSLPVGNDDSTAPSNSINLEPGEQNTYWSDSLRFPPMPWLGAAHDGHPRSTSLHDYVQRRYTVGMTRREHLALWQAALSCGLLEILAESSIPEHLLICRDAAYGVDGPVFTSRNLSRIVYHAFRALCNKVPSQRVVHARRCWVSIERALRSCEEALLDHQCILDGIGLTKNQINDIICCIILLGATLQQILTAAVTYVLKIDPFGQKGDIGLSVYTAGKAFKRQMAIQGWCSYTVKTMPLDFILLGFAYNCRPFTTTFTFEHLFCVEDRCITQDIIPTHHMTEHVSPTCSCCPITPPFSTISNLLTSRKVPVVRYDSDGQQLLVRRAEDGPYVAISHVWADGLRSTAEKGLPACQVARIASYARQVVPDGSFWIDALCIPESQHLRRQAIELMYQTYRSADKVIVFDKGIRALCSRDTPLGEIVMRITTSRWMNRVWTLQEALLARELFFEFSDGLCSIRWLQGHDRALSSAQLCFNRAIVAPLSGLTHRETYTFSDISALLHHRTTSQPVDETISVAGLLDVDITRLLVVEDVEARIRALFLELRTLPVHIMFLPGCPLMRYPGFCWAPRTLTSIGPIPTSHGTAFCTSNGLTTEQEFYVITFPTVNPADTAFPPDEYDSFYIDLPSNQSAYGNGTNYSFPLRIPRTEPIYELLPFNAVVASTIDESGPVSTWSDHIAVVYIPELEESQESPIIHCEYRFAKVWRSCSMIRRMINMEDRTARKPWLRPWDTFVEGHVRKARVHVR